MENLLLTKLKERAMSKLQAMSLLILIAMFLLVSTLLTYYDVINIVEMTDKNESWLLVFTSIFLVGSIGVTLANMIPYFLDYKSVKAKSYVVLTAVVSRFDFYESGYEPIERHWFPVFEDVDSGKALTLEINEKVEIGEQYFIVYLPRTKIAVIKNK